MQPQCSDIYNQYFAFTQKLVQDQWALLYEQDNKKDKLRDYLKYFGITRATPTTTEQVYGVWRPETTKKAGILWVRPPL